MASKAGQCVVVVLLSMYTLLQHFLKYGCFETCVMKETNVSFRSPRDEAQSGGSTRGGETSCGGGGEGGERRRGGRPKSGY